MERQRYNVIHVFINKLVVVSQVVEQGFFVADKMVELEVVVHAEGAEVGGLRGFEIEGGLVIIVNCVIGFVFLWDYGVKIILWKVTQSFLKIV
jgi:hypothetical protein